MIKAIFFDAAGTLFHLSRSVGDYYAEVAHQLGVDLSADTLDSAFLYAWKRAPIRAAIGKPRDNDDRGWWRELVELVLSRVPDVPADLDRNRFFDLAYGHFAEPGAWALYPEVLAVLRELAPKFSLSVISNFDRRLHAIMRNLEIAHFFKHVFISSELGADKPDPEIYRRALARSGFAANETVHAGDDPERDWAGSAAAGLHVFKLNRCRNSLRDLPAFIASQAPFLRMQPK